MSELVQVITWEMAITILGRKTIATKSNAVLIMAFGLLTSFCSQQSRSQSGPLSIRAHIGGAVVPLSRMRDFITGYGHGEFENESVSLLGGLAVTYGFDSNFSIAVITSVNEVRPIFYPDRQAAPEANASWKFLTVPVEARVEYHIPPVLRGANLNIGVGLSAVFASLQQDSNYGIVSETQEPRVWFPRSSTTTSSLGITAAAGVDIPLSSQMSIILQTSYLRTGEVTSFQVSEGQGPAGLKQLPVNLSSFYATLGIGLHL
ncbi:MAG: hypothetical protein HYZ01_01285 [Ignavibacteriales bacterium]|nr:hypothetical protein [Ignavibacteriales bacterium]